MEMKKVKKKNKKKALALSAAVLPLLLSFIFSKLPEIDQINGIQDIPKILNLLLEEEENPVGLVNAKVVRVVDGDTVVVRYEGREERIRLIGVDTPETVHPNKPVEAYGEEAKEYTKKKLEEKDIQIEFDVQERDRYGRLLGYIWLDGLLFNDELLRMGYARVATFPPNVKYVETFKETERNAREKQVGLWGET
jgi:micrococcal nuclease